MKTGKHSVVIGNVPSDAEVGEGSVVIGPTDANGNVYLTSPGAFGYGARASPGSIAVGAFAGAGTAAVDLPFPEQLRSELTALVSLAASQQKVEVLEALQQISQELQKTTPDPGLIHSAWAGVQALATIDGAHGLLSKATIALFSYLQGSA